jgi:Domain of unknown function (DUF6456)
MEKLKKPPEKLATVRINNGQHAADLVRECDPSGAIVEHRVRRSSYVHERLHTLSGPQKLPDELYDAAEKFRMDFERAQLSGNYARLDMFSTRSGKVEMSDKLAQAKGRISKAFQALGNGSEVPSLSQSCIWSVVGLGETLEDWTQTVRNSGKGMNTDRASGVLYISLERLALHFGMVDMGRLQTMSNDRAYARAIQDFLDFASVATATLQGNDKSAVGKFIAATRKRFEKFA